MKKKNWDYHLLQNKEENFRISRQKGVTCLLSHAKCNVQSSYRNHLDSPNLSLNGQNFHWWSGALPQSWVSSLGGGGQVRGVVLTVEHHWDYQVSVQQKEGLLQFFVTFPKTKIVSPFMKSSYKIHFCHYFAVTRFSLIHSKIIYLLIRTNKKDLQTKGILSNQYKDATHILSAGMQVIFPKICHCFVRFCL